MEDTNLVSNENENENVRISNDSTSTKSSEDLFDEQQNVSLSPKRKNYVREMAKKFESLNDHETCYTHCNWWTKTPTTFTYFDETDSPKLNDIEKNNDENNVILDNILLDER